MKIETDFSKNYFACFNEARGIARHKKKILENRKNKGYTYMFNKVIIFIWVFILGIIFTFICAKIESCSKLCFLIPYIFIGDILYMALNLVSIFSLYYERKKCGFKNTIRFDKTGITDESFYGIKMLFKWKKVKAVVFGKYTITVLTDTPVYFYFSIKDKHYVMEALDKFASLSLIIQ